MAEVNGSTEEPPAEGGRRAVDAPAEAPTTPEEARAAPPAENRVSAAPVRPEDDTRLEEATDEEVPPAAARAEGPAEAVAVPVERADEPAPGTREDAEERTAPPVEGPVPTTAREQPVLAPAEEPAPAPQKSSNRLVGTAWVLLAAGLFEVLFFAVNAFVALVFGGAGAVLPQIQSIAGTALAWLPVLLFFLLFELTVLIINRGSRVAYVLASLVVAIVVYVLTVLLFSVIVRHTLGDVNTLAQTFLNWEFILVGLVAREVMLWTGLAIGARGIRVRNRYRADRQQYEERSDASV